MKIKKISVNNFKSLVDFKLESLNSTTIIYGDNNAGKSNVLELLHLIFQRKKQYNDETITEQAISFHTGILDDFTYSFYENRREGKIDFSIVVEVKKSELTLKDADFEKIFGAKDELEIGFNGIIKQFESNSNYGRFDITEVNFEGGKLYTNKDDEIHILPLIDKEKNDQAVQNEIFETLIEPFQDCVFFVPSHRDMLPDLFDKNLEAEISPLKFKKFLYSLYLKEDQFSTFERIDSLFNNDPFSFGSLSFAKIDDNLEIMIKKGDIRLPIKGLGSGVLQILYIISCIVYSNKKIICLEELEQNLSPNNQKLALNKLKELISDVAPPNQIIISSHSPYFYEKNGHNSTYLLSKKDGKTILLARNGEEPRKDPDFDEKEIEYYADHFPDIEDWH